MMKKLFITVLILLPLAYVSTEAQTKSENLILTVTGLRNNNGKVIAAVFNSSEGFPEEREKSVRHKTAVIKDSCSIIVFDKLPYGTYAIGIVHDENNNGTMDFSFFFIPKEGYGTSNNTKVRFSPPDFDDAKFNFSSSNYKLSIKINY